MDDRQQIRILIVVLSLLSVGTVMDLFFDQPDTLLSLHVVLEISLATFGLCAVAFFWQRYRRAGRDLQRTRAEAVQREKERDEWRARTETFITGLGNEINRQFLDWQLSPTERETALMLLKGLELKSIADLQGKSERTVRQHASAVYRKAGLGGRAELSAFFLEDLLLPAEDQGT